jgi:hypothetical protein
MQNLISWWIAKRQLGERTSLRHPSWLDGVRVELEEWNNPKSDYILRGANGEVLEDNWYPNKAEQKSGWEVIKEDESWRMEVPF